MIIMTDNKRKKNSRQRGKRWHGWGRGQAHHKGAGNRGGRGRAGSGKRGDSKKPTYQKEGKGYLGRNGFTSHSRTAINAINLCKLQDMMIKNDLKGAINLADLGYNKLLGTGNVTAKLEITVDFASAKAVEKVLAAGGSVLTLNADDAPAKEAVEEAEA